MKKIIIPIVIIIIIGAFSYWLYQSISGPQEISETEAKNCEADSDCIVFGEDGDCNCGCFNKDYQWEKEGDCFCVAPNSCKCVNGKCQGVFEEEETVEEKGVPEEQGEEEIALGGEEGKKEEEIIPKEEGPEEVSNATRVGKIERDEIWSGQIDIIGDILVEEGVTLTILPGTQVVILANKDTQNLFGHWECDGIENYDLLIGIKEEDNYNCGVHEGEPFRDENNHISIQINGTLHAVGTPEQMITITSDSPTPGIYDWNHFQFSHGIFSYCIMEYYRCFDPGNGTVVNHNILRHVGECAVCANSSVVVENNTIYDAGHELVDMHNAFPTIRNNTIGPNNNRCCIVIDGGSPLITGNTIKDCGSGLLLLVSPEDPNLKDNILKNNTFLNNGEDISYGY
ncbi:hypothetical protein AMJ48_02700 [Parcubacteria bacterium DG_74_1]|nr:MAG: hypothetical protein AMJ48_02700 [Parcubacteria bacterium DG_74_1]